MGYLETAMAYVATLPAEQLQPVQPSPESPPKCPAPGSGSPCDHGTPCDNHETGARYCREWCRPAFERDAARLHPDDCAPGPNAPRPEWHVEIETEWPQDYQVAWSELTESAQHAGQSQPDAELWAYNQLVADARRFAALDAAKEAA